LLDNAEDKRLINEGCYGSWSGKEARTLVFMEMMEMEISCSSWKPFIKFDKWRHLMLRSHCNGHGNAHLMNVRITLQCSCRLREDIRRCLLQDQNHVRSFGRRVLALQGIPHLWHWTGEPQLTDLLVTHM
jgi:hypothetical protein